MVFSSLLFLPQSFVDFSDVAACLQKSDTFVMTFNFINYSEQAGVENRGCFFLITSITPYLTEQK